MACVDRVRAVDWSDHGGLLRGRIGRGIANFNFAAKSWLTVGKVTSVMSPSPQLGFVGGTLDTPESHRADMGSFALLRMTIKESQDDNKKEDRMSEQNYNVILRGMRERVTLVLSS